MDLKTLLVAFLKGLGSLALVIIASLVYAIILNFLPFWVGASIAITAALLLLITFH